jgi:hypothetical protein
VTWYLAEIGLATAFGPTLAATFEAMETQRSAYFANPAFIGSSFRRQVCAFRSPEEIGTLEDRCKALLAEALDDLCQRLDARSGFSSQAVTVFLNLPESTDEDGVPEDRLFDLAKDLAELLTARLKDFGKLRPLKVVVGFGGQAGAAAVLASLGNPEASASVLLLCVDSFSDAKRLQALADQQLLLTSESAYGLVPGEAGGAMLFMTERSPENTPLAQLMGAAVETEPVGERQEKNSVFAALSDAAFAALKGVSAPVSQLVSDWNNSRYKASELAYAVHRLSGDHLPAGLEPSYPGPAFGDVGAAFMPVATAFALGFHLDPPPASEPALFLAGSTHSCERGAVVFMSAPDT